LNITYDTIYTLLVIVFSTVLDPDLFCMMTMNCINYSSRMMKSLVSITSIVICDQSKTRFDRDEFLLFLLFSGPCS